MARQETEPTVVVRGDVDEETVAYARRKLLAAVARVTVPVLLLEARLDRHADPARERPCHVELAIDLNGHPVRARRSGPTMTEAIDRAAERLARRVESALERPQRRRLRHRHHDSWHHDDAPTPRAHVFPRPVDERAITRRKTFALHPESIEHALFDLEMLDHDFFLFVHDDTRAEAVVYRTEDGYGVRQRVATPDAIARVEIDLHTGPTPPTLTVDEAIALLDDTNAPFEFFVDPDTDRGLVVYQRYDGHYGMILPS